MGTSRSFPDGFQWGTATAAHQIEGGNVGNDWWDWEHAESTPCVESSGDACDSWHRWAQDVDLVADLGFDTYRFSVEWSRIEPAPGEFSIVALDHYKALCEALRTRGVRPVVTLHHFTTPHWLATQGGWENPAIVDAFGAFVARVVAHLDDLPAAYCTINEPNIVASMGYLAAMFPPGRSDRDARRRVNDVFVSAHRRAVATVRDARPEIPVGLTLAMADYQAVDGGEAKLEQIRTSMEDVFLHATEGDDFLGVQTYTRTRVGPDGARHDAADGRDLLVMGYEYYPEALAACLRRAWSVTGGNVPLIVTENGIGTDDDAQRIAYVRTALEGVLDVIAEGIDVRGYTYWSLLDNFEWALGYGPRFGLVSCDRSTFVRTPKPSAQWLGAIARANTFDGS